MTEAHPFVRDRRRIRWSLGLLTTATTAVAMLVFWSLLGAREGHLENVVDLPLLLLFSAMFLLVSFSFWTATFGFVHALRLPTGPAPSHRAPQADGQRALPRTAIVMPIYNEEPHRSFAGLRAVYESIQELGLGPAFDLFVLSDSTDPDIWLEEELAWAVLRTSLSGESGLYYRHRPRNIGRKSGNIVDFLERWGLAYTYMVILDADSVMSGSTLLQMVRRMEEDPQIGILQVPPVPVNRASLFARSQEFSASVYGPVFTWGVAGWSQEDSNYWGHNAIIRVQPFIEHCGLPLLPGEAPLGGEILSHDFVEAALMRRAGWKVVLAHDLEGSYEECPVTLLDYAKRNRRWCEGNLQHLRLLLVDGFHPVSRIHFGTGALSYLSSLLWLLFLVLGFVRAATQEVGRIAFLAAPSPLGISPGYDAFLLFFGTMALLLLPKLWGYLLLLRDRDRLAAHGGALRAGASVLLETLISVLIAPILMAFNARFVLATFTGESISWTAQQRGERPTSFGEAVRAYGGLTLVGVLAMLAVGWLSPGLFWWMLPVTVGLIFSVPLSMALSSVALGQRLRAWGLLLIQAETAAPPLLERQQQLLEAAEREGGPAPRPDRFSQFVLDPVLHQVHLALLQEVEQPSDRAPQAARCEELARAALLQGPGSLDRAEKRALLGDPAALHRLHGGAWSCWPLQTLDEVAGAAAPLRPPEPVDARSG